MKTPDINKILKNPCYCASNKYGANKGRRNQNEGKPEPLYLQRVRFVDGDYDTGGAYWGGGFRLYCGFSTVEESINCTPIMIFVRGKDHKEAKQNVLKEVKNRGFSFKN